MKCDKYFSYKKDKIDANVCFNVKFSGEILKMQVVHSEIVLQIKCNEVLPLLL